MSCRPELGLVVDELAISVLGALVRVVDELPVAVQLVLVVGGWWWSWWRSASWR